MVRVSNLSQGTEHRNQFQLYSDATMGAGSATKPALEVGPDRTASRTGLPWPQPAVPAEVNWTKKVWAPIGVHPLHFRPISTQIGAARQAPFHRHDRVEKANPAPMVRYLQVDLYIHILRTIYIVCGGSEVEVRQTPAPLVRYLQGWIVPYI